MTVEAEAIPFQPAELRGERLLVLAPHPDDEVIACGGLLAQHIRERREVRIVVATDGTAAEGAGDAEAYRTQREEESRRGLEILGGAEIIFLRHRDRHLSSVAERFVQQLRDVLIDFSPSLILAPSPIEIHPDHRDTAVALCEAVQRDGELAGRLAIARVAFYELTQPIRPNSIVDISDVADNKYAAIAAHASQAALRDYAAYARGLNEYRAMTMPPGTTHAEAYYVIGLPQLRTTPVSELARLMGDARSIVTVEHEQIPITVVVRTRNRPALLKEAVASIKGAEQAAEIVVVNDGGSTPDWLSTIDPAIRLIEHPTSRGRSEAANAGVRAANSPFVCFLDDDDLHYPEHLAVLGRAISTSNGRPVYSDAVSAFVSLGPDGALHTDRRLRLFAHDFDRDLLLVDNYIPLPTLLLQKQQFLDAGGFSPEFDLFEDWDFLIRLSRMTDFVRVPRITCEIRHIQTSGSIILSAPEGSEAFRTAKLAVWNKHRDLVTPAVFASAFATQKRAANQLAADLTDHQGRGHHLQEDVRRLEREKLELIGRLQIFNDKLNEQTIRAEGMAVALREVQNDNREVRAAHEARGTEILQLRERNLELKSAFEETQTTVQAVYAELHRIQGQLDMIYGSRTWKLHNVVERMRGRR